MRRMILLACLLCCAGCIHGRTTLCASTTIDDVDYRFEWSTDDVTRHDVPPRR
jgi:hypothetical protein